jgi:hypothetical protein
MGENIIEQAACCSCEDLGGFVLRSWNPSVGERGAEQPAHKMNGKSDSIDVRGEWDSAKVFVEIERFGGSRRS